MKLSITGTRFRRLARLAAVAFVAVPLLAACGGGSGGSSSTLNLGITDGPVDSASSVVVSFTGVELQPSGGGKAITFTFNTPETIDLLKEQNGNEAALLTGVAVPAGNYDWIRLILNVGSNGTVAGSYITINGAQYPLIIPSGAQTGLKLVQGFTMTANQVANFTIDFMLQQSITAPPGQTSGGTQDYILKPALRLIDNVQAGTLSGTVTLSSLPSSCQSGYTGSGPLPNAHVYIFSGTVDATATPFSTLTPVVEPQITLSSTGNYTYDQPFLLAGPYTLAVACTSTTNGTTTVSYNPAAGKDATVTANQTTTVNLP